MNVHIGNIIRNYLYEHKITPPVFAKMMGIDPKAISVSIYSKHYMSTMKIVKISQILNHNFFQYYLAEQPEVKKKYEELEKQLSDLRTENERLKSENKYLKELYTLMKEKVK